MNHLLDPSSASLGFKTFIGESIKIKISQGAFNVFDGSGVLVKATTKGYGCNRFYSCTCKMPYFIRRFFLISTFAATPKKITDTDLFILENAGKSQ